MWEQSGDRDSTGGFHTFLSPDFILMFFPLPTLFVFRSLSAFLVGWHRDAAHKGVTGVIYCLCRDEGRYDSAQLQRGYQVVSVIPQVVLGATSFSRVIGQATKPFTTVKRGKST